MNEKLDPGSQKTTGFVIRQAYSALPDTTASVSATIAIQAK